MDIFVRNEYWNAGLHSISETSERSWVTLHTELGPLLIGVWYRPPDEAPEELASLTEELEKHSIGHIRTFLCCDANVHQKKWLRYSDGNTNLGQKLQDICSDAGLTQIVREPTRKENLLDLIVTSMPESSKATVVGSVSDHRAVFCATNIDVPQIVEVEREVWNFRDADWDGLRGALRKRDWDYIKTLDVDEGAASLTNDILDAAKTFIPKRIIKDKKCSHPWINDQCRAANERKQSAEKVLLQNIQDATNGGVESLNLESKLQECIKECNTVIGEAFEQHVERIREKIRILPRGSKEWWRLNGLLLGRAKKNVSIPPLRNPNNEWVLDSTEKANLFGDTFASKCKLPEKDGQWIPKRLSSEQSCFSMLRVRKTKAILKQINPDKATGPDQLPGRILKECADELAYPVTLLAGQMLKFRQWPDCWRDHWLAPIFKKGSVANPEKYRGVHLTSVLSKVVEGVIAEVLVKYLEESGASGETQWAFREGHSCRDLVALLTATWVLDLHAGKKIGVYLSDISGAFDRVESEMLLEKLKAAGLNEDTLLFLESYLQPRRATVLVTGAKSEERVLENSVFQGTRLGPPLWNVFFQDVSLSVPEAYKETKFADDLSCSKAFEKDTPN